MPRGSELSDGEEEDEIVFTQDQKNVDKIARGILLFSTVCLIPPMASKTGWQTKTTHIWTFYLGLFRVEAKLDTLIGLLVKTSGAILDKIGGAGGTVKERSTLVQTFEPTEPRSIQWMRDQLCNADVFTGGFLNSCPIWQKMLMGTYAGALGLTLCLICALCACGLLTLPPSKCSRLSAVACLAGGWLVGAGGLAAYLALTWQFQEWLVAAQIATGGITYDFYTLFVAVDLVLMLVCIPLLLGGGTSKSFMGKKAKGGSSSGSSSYDEGFGPPGGFDGKGKGGFDNGKGKDGFDPGFGYDDGKGKGGMDPGLGGYDDGKGKGGMDQGKGGYAPYAEPGFEQQGMPFQGMPPQGFDGQGMPPQGGQMPPPPQTPEYSAPWNDPQGVPPQGMPPQGYDQQGMPQGMPPQGFDQQGMPLQNMPPQGFDQQGMPPQGFDQQGMPQGMPPQGFNQPGMPPQGFDQQGMPPQGMPPQGYDQQGMPQGMPPQGFDQQGMPPQGMPPLGLPPQGKGQPGF